MPRAGLTSASVVDAAASIADAEGLQAVSLARVATVLGVRPPSLYEHIAGLDDLLRRLGTRGAFELAAELGHAVEGRSGMDALSALALAYRNYSRSHPGLYAAAQRSRELESDLEAVAAGRAAIGVLLAVLRGYGLDGDDAVHAIRAIRAALHGFVSLEAEAGFALELPLEESFERLVALLDRGLRGGSPATAARRPRRGS
jgi:AcrR family transcriptional regulator